MIYNSKKQKIKHLYTKLAFRRLIGLSTHIHNAKQTVHNELTQNGEQRTHATQSKYKENKVLLVLLGLNIRRKSPILFLEKYKL